MSTFENAITDARTLLNDTEATYTWSDTDLMLYANDGLALMCVLRPDLFTTTTTFACAAGAIQTLPTNAVRLMEVFCVSGGNTVTEVPRETLDRFSPGWMSETNGTPVNWARNPRSSRTFFVHPPATAALNLIVQYAVPPTRTTATNDTLPISDAYFPALVDYIVGRAEMRDDEHANDGRADQLMRMMVEAMRAGDEHKPATDREDAAIPGSSKVARNG